MNKLNPVLMAVVGIAMLSLSVSAQAACQNACGSDAKPVCGGDYAELGTNVYLAQFQNPNFLSGSPFRASDNYSAERMEKIDNNKNLTVCVQDYLAPGQNKAGYWIHFNDDGGDAKKLFD